MDCAKWDLDGLAQDISPIIAAQSPDVKVVEAIDTFYMYVSLSTPFCTVSNDPFMAEPFVTYISPIFPNGRISVVHDEQPNKRSNSRTSSCSSLKSTTAENGDNAFGKGPNR